MIDLNNLGFPIFVIDLDGDKIKAHPEVEEEQERFISHKSISTCEFPEEKEYRTKMLEKVQSRLGLSYLSVKFGLQIEKWEEKNEIRRKYLEEENSMPEITAIPRDCREGYKLVETAVIVDQVREELMAGEYRVDFLRKYESMVDEFAEQTTEIAKVLKEIDEKENYDQLNKVKNNQLPLLEDKVDKLKKKIAKFEPEDCDDDEEETVDERYCRKLFEFMNDIRIDMKAFADLFDSCIKGMQNQEELEGYN